MSSLSEQIEETDVYQDLCWEHLSDEYVCSRPLVGKQTTYTECCCLYGEAWGMQCALCPMKDSGEPLSNSFCWRPLETDSSHLLWSLTILLLSSPSCLTSYFHGCVYREPRSRIAETSGSWFIPPLQTLSIFETLIPFSLKSDK